MSCQQSWQTGGKIKFASAAALWRTAAALRATPHARVAGRASYESVFVICDIVHLASFTLASFTYPGILYPGIAQLNGHRLTVGSSGLHLAI